MSNTYRIHGARFLRKYTAADRSSSYAYMADVKKIANTLCKVPWERVAGDIAATMTLHTKDTLDWNAPERERFDAAEWCAEHSDGMHRAYAQAACYAFELPQSAIGTAIEKISVNVTSDPYNPYGARISALTSATFAIPMDCATVRTGDVYREPDENGLGAAPRLYVNNSNGTQTWYSNSELVELEPSETLAAKRYLFIFVCLENYNRGREGWIEGSSYIENDVTITLASACADLDATELNDLSPLRVPTTLNLVNLATRATDATITLSGPVYSMVPLFLEHGSGGGTSGDHGCQYAVITGDFDEYSVSGMPGLVVYDFVNREIVSIAEESGHEIPATVKAAWRISGVMAHLASPVRIEFMCAYAPARCFAKAIIQFTRNTTTGVVTAYYEGSSSVNLRRTAEAADLSVMHRGDALFSFYQDRIDISSNGSGGEPRLPELQIPFSGKVSHVGVSISLCNHGSILICGDNSVDGDKSAVKLLMPNGNVLNFFVDLTPDNYADFAADEFVASGCGAGFAFGGFLTNDDATVFGVASGNAARPSGSNNYTTESSGYRLVTKNGKDDPELISLAQSFGCVIAGQISLLITGRFTKIGGLKANGAAILMYNAPSSTVDCQMSLVPLDVGPVRRGVVFVSDGSPLPLHVSHMLIEPA